jgi:hypothetical protein
MAELTVKIKENGTVLVKDRTKKVSKLGKDDVKWVAAGKGGPWKVVFPNGSPFAADSFDVSPKNEGRSGDAINGDPGKSYKYDIQDQHGNVTEDPEILIDL